MTLVGLLGGGGGGVVNKVRLQMGLCVGLTPA